MKERDLFLFDFDGVLADSLDLYAEAVTRCLERIGTPIVKTREDYLALFDGNFYESMAAQGVDLAAFAQAAKEIMPGIDYDAMKPFDGLLPVLDCLEKDHLLAVISSNGLEDHPQDARSVSDSIPISRRSSAPIFWSARRRRSITPLRSTAFRRREPSTSAIRRGTSWRPGPPASGRWPSPGDGTAGKGSLAAHPDFLVDTPEGLLKI